MRLFLATGNKHKVSEMSLLLKHFNVELRQSKIDLIEPDFGKQEEVAMFKARQAFEKLKKPVIAEDTGVYFEGYNNFPGLLAKRVFLGLGFDGLTCLVKSTKNKKAYFKTVVAYCDGKTTKTFSGILKGRLLEKVVSVEKDRLPYEKIFVPAGYSKALVDIPISEKNKISHRAIATKKFGKWAAEQDFRTTNRL